MGTTPQFAATPRHTAIALSGTIETSLTTPTEAVTIFTPGANGSKIEEIVIDMQKTALTPQAAAGLIYLFTYDGTNYWMFDTIAVAAVTASTTVAPFRSAPSRYPNLWLQSTEKLYASISVAPTSGLFVAHVFAGDY